MADPTAVSCPLACACAGSYCDRCDVLVGLDGFHVIDLDAGGARLRVVVESPPPGPVACPVCGVIARSHGRRSRRLVDIPSFGRAVELTWRTRTWRCAEPRCSSGSFTEQAPDLAPPRALITTRARWWALRQLRFEGANVRGLARQLGTTWRTVWRSVEPLLTAMAGDESRFAGVSELGVDEHVWHHVRVKDRGPKELTGMVDLSRDRRGRVHARLLDLVPGRSGRVYLDWLRARGPVFTAGIAVATLDPFHGYKNAIDDGLQDAVAVLDAFHVVKLATAACDDVRRRVQQQTLGHRGRRGDPLYGIRTTLRAGAENLTPRQHERLHAAFTAHPDHVAVEVAWRCSQDVRAVYHQPTPAQGRALAEKLIATLPTCPIPEIARLGKTLRTWRSAFLAYFTTGGASNGGTEAINGLIELHRRVARGFRNRENYRLRMLLIAGGLSNPRLA